METRNISLTLEKAREWYNSGSADLKEVALQAYTKEELFIPKFTEIKTFWSAVRALGLDERSVLNTLSVLNSNSHLRAIYKLDIIHKALNGGWNPKMTKGIIYYPFARFYPAGEGAIQVAKNAGWLVGDTFIVDGKKYSLVGGEYRSCHGGGLSYFGCGYGSISADLGLLGCKSEEVAQHMSRYFVKEIFEACYTQLGVYEWV